MMTMQKLEQKLQRADRKQAALYLFCNFISLMLISAYSAMIFSPTILTVLPEGGDSRKQMIAIFVLALFGCTVFTVYAASLFFRKKSRQIGTLMALGASRRRLAPGLFREVFTLSTVSALAGLLTGFPFVWILWSLFRMLIVDSAQMDLVLDFRCLLVSIPFFLIVVLFSCITAFRYLKRTNIMDTIREEHKNEPVRELGRWCGPVGIIVLLIGAVAGYNASAVYQHLFSAFPPVWINVLYVPVFIGLYMIILHTVVHGWGQNKKNPYKTLISRSMMKFQGRQTVNNLLVSTVLIAGVCFGLFFLPMMGSSQLLETKNRPFDYLFQYRADQNVPTKTAIEELAGQYNLDLKDWSSGEYLYLALDGQEIFEDGRSYHYEYTPLLQGGKFLSESSFSELTGMDVDVKPGTYKGVSNDEETGTYFMNLKSELLTNLSTMSTCDTKFDGFIHYGLLVDQRGYYVLDDADYAAMKEGISDEYRGNMFAFNINGEDSYDFAYELFLAFMGSFTEDCELPIYYDPVEKYACEQRGETYWGDTGEMTQVSFDDPDSSDFRMYWTYMPKIRILDQNDYMRTYAVYLMMFLFIAIICILAAMVIGYTRCQTIALNNRYLFDDLKKLGAASAFLTREVKSQCKKVFRTPSIIGISLMFLLYSLIMFGNDGALTYSEIIGLFACAGSLLIVSLVIYMVYRLTVRKVKEELNIH